MTVHRSVLTTAGVAAAVALTLAGCSTATKEKDTASSTSASSTAQSSSAAAAPAAGDLVGSGCAAYAQKVPSGPGSVAGMAKDPVATAASNSPVLTTLTGALSGKLNPDVNLVETLNNGQFTVFAPTDEAFGKVDPATIEKLKTDSALLTSVLTYHVVPAQADPSQVAGEHKTVQGAPLTVTGAGNDLKVNGAGVVCGGIKTANATVYLIDTVLMPPAQSPATPASPTSATPTP
ncbi:MAG TPA: fasciclin domain-containing protein [Mycobacterium sp.]|uniref:fasciclin domain-containing protein n=1 Tax=Mycolicibacterium sp. TaxID=2320850 RepID=UPI0025F2CABF|nr:fasciclin domain-containing protein [Mycolicibacterium sp.]HPX36313.1 fasciclin domain-containing protein [Mycobacterium sp.]HQC75122.1 fasciclin domain-containing protein [Mycobacterium sp.]